MTCKPGDLVLIPFPYADLQSAKRRPVLVLTSPDSYGDFIALAVTSVEQTRQAIPLKEADLLECKLPKPSWIRLDKVFTLTESSIVRTFGSIRPDLFRKVLCGFCIGVGYICGKD